MFNFIRDTFFKRKTFTAKGKRVFIDYFSNPAYNTELQQNGYVILKQAALETELDFLSKSFEQLQQLPGYSINDKFQNSGRFQSTEIRSFVISTIETFSKPLLARIFSKGVYDENTSGAFQIKPPSKNSALNPHQDSPVIDELQYSGLFVWIPLCDITLQNGPVYVLPGSHRWGNHQRSLNVPWIFEKHTKTLWKHMIPVTLQRGDILCWDTALIHASSPNLSNEIRVAITTTILPSHFKMVDYYKDKDTPAGKIEKYRVEKSFWESGDIMKRPPVPPNALLELEDEAFPMQLSSGEVTDLVKQTWPPAKS